MFCLHILEIKLLLIKSFAKIFSHSVGCLFILFRDMYIFELKFSPDTCPGVGLLDHMVGLYLVFLGTSINVFP